MISAPAAARPISSLIPVVDDVARLRVVMVNVYFVGDPHAERGGWVLVDAGMPRSAGAIIRAAEDRFGPGATPRAIVLTHGHFDHVGALPELLKAWPNVPVYAHEMEMPYLTGKSSYPPPDPMVGHGMFSLMSVLYPKKPIDISDRVFALPTDGTIPQMPGWQWIATPGHSPGHVSLFRESDRTLIAGDAFVTTRQESVLSVLTQRLEMNGPPRYFTPDWDAARDSVRKLWDLRPFVAATGHGVPMRGAALARDLQNLSENFDQIARPAHGRYVEKPAVTDRNGVVAVPPPAVNPYVTIGAIAAAAVAVTLVAKAVHARDADDVDDDFIEHGA
jgi:glyoxylase-like metal-dependent hydrolase (beta-lactamase superfamily II)